jgi:hypothetical protein
MIFAGVGDHVQFGIGIPNEPLRHHVTCSARAHDTLSVGPLSPGRPSRRHPIARRLAVVVHAAVIQLSGIHMIKS